MVRNDRFTKGTFNCEACGRLTRGSADSADLGICFEDYEIGAYFNSWQDGDTETLDGAKVYVLDLIEKIKKKGGTPDGDTDTLIRYYETGEI